MSTIHSHNTFQEPQELPPQAMQVAGGLAVRPVAELNEVMIGDQLRDYVKAEVSTAVINFKDAVDAVDYVDVPEADRHTKLIFRDQNPVDYQTSSGWTPKNVKSYESRDPFSIANPFLVKAAGDFVETTVGIAARTAHSQDPTLTYLNLKRANKGKGETELTKGIRSIDAGVSQWVVDLPAAEGLRPVAKPWMDISTVTADTKAKDENGNPTTRISSRPNTKYQVALVGGAKDGLGVREREGWERAVMLEHIDVDKLEDKTLRITSLGTGTGEPAMDCGLALTSGIEGARVEVNGFDVNPNSLAVASYLANKKSNENDDRLQFNGGFANILSAEGIKLSVAGKPADIYEAIGFAEYVASARSKDPVEQKQRDLMERGGCLSAEDFYKNIYDNMPVGSVLLSGNMRDDSPQAGFVIDGLGWKGIIQRDTNTFLEILEHAGIPAEAVSLYVPDAEESSGVYNLVTIKKI